MTLRQKLYLPEDRFFGPDVKQKEIAKKLYERVVNLPLICPHGHVEPRLLGDPNFKFGTPTELLIIPDHYIFRMLYSMGIPMENLGIPRVDGGEVEQDHRKIWQLFADHFYLFRGTPTGTWLDHELFDVFGVEDKLCGESAQDVYDQIAACLLKPEFQPRCLFERFNIEVLTTTDAASSTLENHQAIKESDWQVRILPTFRPDDVITLDIPGWHENIDRLAQVSGIEVRNYSTFIQALENRRTFFKELGATTTDHGVSTPFTEELSPQGIEALFQRAFKRKATPKDAACFSGHMLMEMARMSIEDGLVMQLHPGVYREHNTFIHNRFGEATGGDIPLTTEYTHNLHALLNKYGNDSRLTLILFTLDETNYARELAPLAGHYPALKLGPPWWFHDSPNGMLRYLEQVSETAGIYNTVGFNDDTRAFPSIPARHDVWRRVASNWVAGLVITGRIDMGDAEEMILDLVYRLVKRAYKF